MVERTAEGKFHPYVMDFGLAQETAGSDHSRTGVIEGTPRYMAPEQARGDSKHLDRRTDLYALGVTLYELLTGTSPHAGTGEMEVLISVLTAEPRSLRAIDPSIPLDLEAVTLKCLEKEPAARYDSARALAEDLGRYLDGEPVRARHIGPLQRLYRKARNHKLLVGLGTALLASVVGFGSYGVRLQLAARKQAGQARQQAELAERLGQEIKDMEWTLRSARQLPLHDLGNEKAIIRQRMAQLQTELASYGELGRGLGHYALGRGHLALHEYPQALAELEQALAHGQDSAEVQYALGLVLGKHYEQAMYEARLSGGGEWAKKQLKEIAPKYLAPAIVALQRSQAMKSRGAGYLEALLAYYQHDYDAALQQAAAVQKSAPWVYELSLLAGDIHLERALEARDSGHYEVAEKEFAAAVHSYEEAAAVGQSDAQVYEALAEVWVRQIEMAKTRGQPAARLYWRAVAASDQIRKAEPQSLSSPLKKAFAVMMNIGTIDAQSAELVEQCLSAAGEVLQIQPGHPYAADAAANCYLFAAQTAQASGIDPEPYLNGGISLLEPVLKQYPRFLWGLNDLANLYNITGRNQVLYGKNSAKNILESSVEKFNLARTLDSNYVGATYGILDAYSAITATLHSDEEILNLLAHSDEAFKQCSHVNSQRPGCYENDSMVYSRAALRLFQAGQDPQPQLKRAFASYATCRKLGGNYLDSEQHTALAHWVDAENQVRHQQDPGPALAELQLALGRCFALAAQDAMCRTLAAQAEWVAADWLALQNLPVLPSLQRGLDKALLATQCAEVYPDKWQVLAETQLRLARAEAPRPSRRDLHLTAGLAAVEQAFLINPNHALGRATQGALWLLRAQSLVDPLARRAAAQSAVTALEQALRSDPFLSSNSAPILVQAKALATAP